MKERPILFSGPMVRAIMARTKRQTRRICKPAQFYSLSKVVEVPDPMERGQVYNGSHFGDEEGDVQFASPYGGRGDRLWVREAWAKTQPMQLPWPQTMIVYRECDNRTDYGGPWKPGIHMFRRDSRITLEVTDVRVERLKDISEADALAEGIVQLRDGGFGLPAGEHYHATDPRISYWSLWEHINGAGSVEANPWVWVIEWPALLNAQSKPPAESGSA